VVWSKYAIPSGVVGRDHAETLQVHLQAHVLAAGARLAMVPYLYSIDQLPRHFSELRRLATKLPRPRLPTRSRDWSSRACRRPRTFSRTRASSSRVRLSRRARRCSVGRRTRRVTPVAAGSLEQWIAQARPTISKLLPGCVFESLLPDAYYVNCRESDRRVRPFGIRAAVAFLENALKAKAPRLQAVVAGFGEERVDEYRVGFSLGDETESRTASSGRSTAARTRTRARPARRVVAQLDECGVDRREALHGTFTPEYCEDCGAPLFANGDGEIVHAELPEEADTHAAHFH
jgi:hypothetical protein